MPALHDIDSLIDKYQQLEIDLWRRRKGFEKSFEDFKNGLNDLYNNSKKFRKAIDEKFNTPIICGLKDIFLLKYNVNKKVISEADCSNYCQGFDLFDSIWKLVNEASQIEKVGSIFLRLRKLKFYYGRIILVKKGEKDNKLFFKWIWNLTIPKYDFYKIKGQAMENSNSGSDDFFEKANKEVRGTANLW